MDLRRECFLSCLEWSLETTYSIRFRSASMASTEFARVFISSRISGLSSATVASISWAIFASSRFSRVRSAGVLGTQPFNVRNEEPDFRKCLSLNLGSKHPLAPFLYARSVVRIVAGSKNGPQSCFRHTNRFRVSSYVNVWSTDGHSCCHGPPNGSTYGYFVVHKLLPMSNQLRFGLSNACLCSGLDASTTRIGLWSRASMPTAV